MEKITNFWKDFWNDEEGLETIEVLLILAVLVAIALLFKERITKWANNLFDNIDEQLHR
ncbi:Flp1 family type IVb pilin [Virgibacillus salarius]|uniref:Flp1 family type IVb pilin n=1 Tax=Virgibacillus salarius TaxID=447199 RepID=UPI002490E2FB|nr:Flp1 family type IVb pilin [Virgibacillus salarius]WBX80596.1 Flp1 family type IVb pilin [Virgibacillus salarius]